MLKIIYELEKQSKGQQNDRYKYQSIKKKYLNCVNFMLGKKYLCKKIRKFLIAMLKNNKVYF